MNPRSTESFEGKEKPIKKVGFFGGTFDPIHNGHLNLAINMMEKHHLDEVIFCPAFVSPHKKTDPPLVSIEHRLAMVALAISPIKTFTLLDWETKSSLPSFTIDTIKALLKKEKHQFHLILGEDSLEKLYTWKEIEELLKLAPPLIGSRLKEWEQTAALTKGSIETIKKGMTRIPLMEISSTSIRDRLSKKLFCGHLIPAKVLDYIYQHQLYCY